MTIGRKNVEIESQVVGKVPRQEVQVQDFFLSPLIQYNNNNNNNHAIIDINDLDPY